MGRVEYQRSRLFNHQIFSDDVLKCLNDIGRESPFQQLISNRRWKEESAINFAITSAQIAGNSYSRADTITLLKIGETANKRYLDAVMIVNLRAAYDYILENASLVLFDPRSEFLKYHSILMQGLLPGNEVGVARTAKGAIMADVDLLSTELAILFDELQKIKDPFAKTIYSSENLSYLQYFEDGNERTSRVFHNAVLMANNLPPVLFPVESIRDYIEATSLYYEQGDAKFIRSFMLKAYKHSYGMHCTNS